MNNDDAAETIWKRITDILEEQMKILLTHRQLIEQLLAEEAKINQRLDKLESADSLNSDDAKFLEDVDERLKAISKVVKEKV